MDLDLATGGAISGWPHVVQSIETLLSTPRGTRVFRRDFGSELLAHLDGPQSEAGLMGLYVALAEALEIWEPRFAGTCLTNGCLFGTNRTPQKFCSTVAVPDSRS